MSFYLRDSVVLIRCKLYVVFPTLMCRREVCFGLDLGIACACVWWVFRWVGGFWICGWLVCLCGSYLFVSCVVFSDIMTEGVLDHFYVEDLRAPM